MGRSESGCPINASGSRITAYVLVGVQQRKAAARTEHTSQAHPRVVPLGARLTRSPPLTVKKFLDIASHLACEHVINRARQFMGQNGQGLALAMFFLQA